MFDWIPTRIWLLLLIGLFAFPAASYVLRYIKNSPTRLDVTQPRSDLDWRTPRMFALSASIVLASVGLAFYIYTPSAEAFAQSPEFMPLLLSALLVWATFATIQGHIKGEIEPLIRGSLGPYSRTEHPRRYWASLIWNVLFIALMTWLIFEI